MKELSEVHLKWVAALEATFQEKISLSEKLGKGKRSDKPTPLGTSFHKDLQISGQIGDVTQKDPTAILYYTNNASTEL